MSQDDVTRPVGPAGPTRALPRQRRLARRAGAGALIIAALAAGRVVTSAYGDDEGVEEPYLVAGSVGRTVDLRYADVTVTGVDGSTCCLERTTWDARRRGLARHPAQIVTKGRPAEVRYAALRGPPKVAPSWPPDPQGQFYPAGSSPGCRVTRACSSSP